MSDERSADEAWGSFARRLASGQEISALFALLGDMRKATRSDAREIAREERAHPSIQALQFSDLVRRVEALEGAERPVYNIGPPFAGLSPAEAARVAEAIRRDLFPATEGGDPDAVDHDSEPPPTTSAPTGQHPRDERKVAEIEREKGRGGGEREEVEEQRDPPGEPRCRWCGRTNRERKGMLCDSMDVRAGTECDYHQPPEPEPEGMPEPVAWVGMDGEEGDPLYSHETVQRLVQERGEADEALAACQAESAGRIHQLEGDTERLARRWGDAQESEQEAWRHWGAARTEVKRLEEERDMLRRCYNERVNQLAEARATIARLRNPEESVEGEVGRIFVDGVETGHRIVRVPEDWPIGTRFTITPVPTEEESDG